MDQPLPKPASVTDFYLAAVLEELRALNETMRRVVQKKPSTAATPVKDDSNLRSNNNTG